jgi:hypothetical protein
MPFVMPHGNEDWVYFQGGDNKLWRSKYDGSQQSPIGSVSIASSPHVMATADGTDWVYYRSTDDNLYKIKYDGTPLSQIGGAASASSPFVTASGWMYFQGTDRKLNRVYVNAGGPSVSGVDLKEHGILTEFDDDQIDDIDNKNFKGIFIRNLGYLYQLRPRARYRAFILNNADWVLDTSNKVINELGQIGGNWSGHFDRADFVRQTAGVDLLNAANAVPPQKNYNSLKQFMNDSKISIPTPLRPILNGAGSLRSVMLV